MPEALFFPGQLSLVQMICYRKGVLVYSVLDNLVEAGLRLARRNKESISTMCTAFMMGLNRSLNICY